MSRRTLVLASASPARRALLRAAGFAPLVLVSGDTEDGVDHLAVRDVARTLAERKAVAVAGRLAARVADGPALVEGTKVDGTTVVVGCDTVLSFAGEVRGKPGSPGQAAAWWRSYRDATGTLVTGHAVVEVGSGDRAVGVAATTVRFGAPTDDEIAALVGTGEPLAVAGGFTIDGFCGPFVTGIEGDHGTVLGLSLPLFRSLLGDLGVTVADLW